MSHVHDQLKHSNDSMQRLVWPAIKNDCGGGILMSIETDGGSVSRHLDTDIGMDFIQKNQQGISRTWAVRMQQVKNYKTFTIRYEKANGVKTEFEKKMLAFDYGGDLPSITCHGYVKQWGDGPFLGCATIKTMELLSYIKQHTRPDGFCNLRKAKNPQDETWFLVIPWKDLQKSGAESLRIFNGGRQIDQMTLSL